MVPGLKTKQMKANELRIGNLVSITYEAKKDVADTCHLDCLSELARDHFVISHFSTDEINVFIGKEIVEFGLSEIEPIPLTAEWLEKFGFAEGNKRCAYLNLPGDEGEFLPFFYVNSRNSVEYVQLMDSMEENEIKRIKYVHQLQNLYFSLTGEELAIKEETK